MHTVAPIHRVVAVQAATSFHRVDVNGKLLLYVEVIHMHTHITLWSACGCTINSFRGVDEYAQSILPAEWTWINNESSPWN